MGGNGRLGTKTKLGEQGHKLQGKAQSLHLRQNLGPRSQARLRKRLSKFFLTRVVAKDFAREGYGVDNGWQSMRDQ